MSGPTTLRPEKVQRLLEACTSIKVKRLLLPMYVGLNKSRVLTEIGR